MKKKTSEMTVAELRARAAEIRAEVNAEGADLDALEAEADEISQRIAQYETEQRRLGIAAKVADGAGAPQDNPTASTDAPDPRPAVQRAPPRRPGRGGDPRRLGERRQAGDPHRGQHRNPGPRWRRRL